MITLTDKAQAEVKRLLGQQAGVSFLRLGVKGGGCSGMSYDVKFDDKSQSDDRVFDVNGIKVACDSKSLLYLEGLSLDYSTELVGGGFKFINPNATGTCGCGTSFSV